MIQSISQNINQYRHPVFKKLEAKDYNVIGGKHAQKIDDEQDFRRKIVEQNERQIFVLGLLSMVVLLGSLFHNMNIFKKTSNKVSKSDASVFIREFESLKDDASVPTIENCKSINADLKAILQNQINYAKAEKDIISEAGNPKPSNRFLLYGPAGVGKSYFAKIYAKSLDADYMEVLYSDFNSMWSGEGVENLMKVFESILETAQNNSNKKHVVVFNEIDTLVQPAEKFSRVTAGTYYLTKLEERSVFLNYLQILKEKTPNVTVIGTTNISPKNNRLDRAAMSRFQNLVEVPYPEADCLFEALKLNLEQIKDSKQFIKNNNQEIQNLAKRMADRKFSFRNLEYVVNDAMNYHLNDMVEGKKNKFKFDYIKKAEQNLKYSDGELEAAKELKK